MFSAAYFTYNGIFSGQYGLRIASFEDSSMQDTAQVTPTINTVKPAKSNKFYLTGVSYDKAPTFDFMIISELPIDIYGRREILTWLEGANSFKELIIHQPEFEDIVYHCIFTVTSIKYHKGNCIGFSVSATFSSPYQESTHIKKVIKSDGIEQYVTIINNSDIQEQYVYPTVKFTAYGNLSGGEQIIIQNITDDAGGTRKFFFKNLLKENDENGVSVEVDNELKKITSEEDLSLLQNFCYSEEDTVSKKNWLRLRKGENVLLVTINGTVEIDCPQYMKIGF